MALIRSTTEIAAKWKEQTPLRQDVYAKNTATPLRDWQKETLAAKDRQKEGMQKALSEDRIAKGVARATTAKWLKRVTTVGPDRWAEGVAVAEPEYIAGFDPYRQVIAATDVGAKYAKGDPRNWERSKRIGLALHEKKVRG